MHRIQVQAVFFDAVGTLFHLRAPVGEMYLACACRHGFEASDPEQARKLTESFRQAFRTQSPLAFPGQPAGRIPALEKEWWRSVVSESFAPFGHPRDFAAFFEELYDLYRGAEAWQLDPDAPDLLETLRSKGKKTGLITNYDSRVFNALDRLGISRLLDSVTISSLVGAAKPDPRIFHAACRALSCLPVEAAHIGDDLEEDWRGATQAGLKAFLYDPTQQDRDPSVARIRKLAELLGILV